MINEFVSTHAVALIGVAVLLAIVVVAIVRARRRAQTLINPPKQVRRFIRDDDNSPDREGDYPPDIQHP